MYNLSGFIIISVFWVVTPCGFVGGYKSFGGTYRLLLQDNSVPPKHWYLPISPHGVTTQKINIGILIAVRTSNSISVNTMNAK
jgi:hypothetical protein